MGEEATFPVGYRFLPTEEELIFNYLMKQPSKHALSKAVRKINIYQYTPWILQRLYPAARVKGSYFITPRNKKYAKGCRPDRHAGKGYWKATSNDKPIMNDRGESFGAVRKTLIYFKKGGLKPERTNWIMKEFRIVKPKDVKSKLDFEDEVLCMIFELKRKPYGSKGAAKQTDDENITYEDEEEENVVSEESKLQPDNAASNSNVIVGSGQPADNGGPCFNDTNSSNYDNTDNILNWIYQMPDDMLDPSCFADIDLPELSYTASSHELRDPDMPYSIAGADNSGVLVVSTKEDSPTCEEDSFPIGVRFAPTDEEIILYYLMKQPCSNPLALVVHDVDWYQHDPWTLQNMYPMVRVKERYFITNLTKKEGGRRSDRKDGVGYWKVVGRDKRILNKDGQSIGGVRRTLFYHEARGLKTNWAIQEYRVGEPGGKKWRHQKSDDTEMQVFCKMYQNQPKNKVLEVKGNAEPEEKQAYNNNDAHMNQPEFKRADDTPLRLPVVPDVFLPVQKSTHLADQNSSSEFPLNPYENHYLVDDQSDEKLGETVAVMSQFLNGIMDFPAQTQAYLGGQALMSFNAGKENILGLPSATPFSNPVAGQTETNTMSICSPPSTYFRENDYLQKNKFSSVGGIEMMMQDRMPYNTAGTADLSQFQNDFMDNDAETMLCRDQRMMPYNAGCADTLSEMNITLWPEMNTTLWPQSPINYYGHDYSQQNEEIEIQGTYDPAEYLSDIWSLG